MIYIIIFLISLILIELLRQRKLDFKYILPVSAVLLGTCIIHKQIQNKYISLMMLGAAGSIIYCLCLVTSYRKKLVRLIQEKAIMKYDIEKRL